MYAERILKVAPERYLVLEREAEFKNEYYDGEIVAMSGASPRHERILVNLTRRVDVHLDNSPCSPLGGSVKVRVGKYYLYPDLMVTCSDELFEEAEDQGMLLNPTVVFEILSPSTQRSDRGVKRELYQQIDSLQHYVLIHQTAPRVDLYTRRTPTEWVVKTVDGLEGVLQLDAIGVSLKLADLYARISFNRNPEVG